MDNSEYYATTFFGTSTKATADLQDFCQHMNSQYPDTFTIVNTNMGFDGLNWTILLIYMC